MAEPLDRTELPETIVLVGAPGAGKSTVGAKLARRLGVDFVDVDQLVEERAAMLISEIFITHGEPTFRALEAELTREAVQRPGVVSLGGGAVMDAGTRQVLAGHHVVWLKVDARQAGRRVGITGNGRPLMAGGNVHSTMVRLMNERAPLYEEVASLAVDTNHRSAGAVVREILAHHGVTVTDEEN
ncbi:shikimate kinase [Luteococcus sp.]|uniref:shikimate kinase n=1 Tax=Luteococcus sp. TaxID=1969402 RepID=UPI0037355D3C